MLNENDKFQMLRAMTIYGGGFAKNLGEAWSRADNENSKKLEEAFPELMERYIKMGKQLQAKEKRQEKDY